jgi:hypothetical protein
MPSSDNRHVLAFYSRHPISRDQILAGVQARQISRTESALRSACASCAVMSCTCRWRLKPWMRSSARKRCCTYRTNVQSFASYPQMLREIGFRNVTVEDLTADWGGILEERFAMYRKLREETARLGTPTGDEEFYRSYARLVALVQERTLGGGRFTAEK